MTLRLVWGGMIAAILGSPAATHAQDINRPQQPRPPAEVTIDSFEKVAPPRPADPPDTLRIPGARLAKAYLWDLSRGVSFLASSGTHAVVPCPPRFRACTDSIMVIQFDSLQRSVAFRIGALKNRTAPIVTVRAYRMDGVILDRQQMAIDTTQPPAIRTMVVVRADSNQISFVHVEVTGTANGLFFLDDLAFGRLLPPEEPPPPPVDSGIRVPNIAGLTVDSARARLENVGLVLGGQSPIKMDTVPGLVIFQGLPPDTLVPRLTEIIVTVSVPIQREDTTDRDTIDGEIDTTGRDGTDQGSAWPWLMLVSLLIVAAAVIWFRPRPNPKDPGKEPHSPPRISATLVAGSHLPQDLTVHEADPRDLALTLAYTITSSYAVTYDSDD